MSVWDLTKDWSVFAGTFTIMSLLSGIALTLWLYLNSHGHLELKPWSKSHGSGYERTENDDSE